MMRAFFQEHGKRYTTDSDGGVKLALFVSRRGKLTGGGRGALRLPEGAQGCLPPFSPGDVVYMREDGSLGAVSEGYFLFFNSPV